MPTLVRQATLLDVLVRRGVLTAAQADEASAQVSGPERQLHASLVADGLLTDAELAQALAEQCGVPYHSLHEFRVDFESFPSIPVDVMRQFECVPIGEEEGAFLLALADPTDLPRLDQLERALGRSCRIHVAPRSAIAESLRESTRNSQVVAKIKDEFRPLLVRENDEGEEVLSVEKVQRDLSPIVQLVDTIILNALQKRASDIHLEPADGVTEIKYRIDGVLYLAMEPLDLRFHNPLVSRIKVMSDLDIAERRVPQDGRFKLRLEKCTIDFRISVIPSAFGESVVIRILAKEEFAAKRNGLHLDSLGLKKDDLDRFRRAITAS